MSDGTPFPDWPDQELTKALQTNTMLNHIWKSGASMEQCITTLCSRLEDAQKRILELNEIAPKVLLCEGKRFVWHCPDELIPESQTFKA